MKVLHRLAKLEDAKRLFDIRRRSIIELASQRMTSAEASAWVEKLTVAGMERKLHELEIWVAEASGGGSWMGCNSGRSIGRPVHDAEFAGRGVGTGLLELVELLMRGRRIPEVKLEASANAEAFYRRRGYERTGAQTSHGAYSMRSACTDQPGVRLTR
jgi:putative acetyltransferase